jgi:hypothetical protein
LGGHVHDRNAKRLHVSCGAREFTKVFRDDVFVERRQKGRGQNQIGHTITELLQSLAGRGRLQEFDAETLSRQPGDLFRLPPVGVNGQNDLHCL